MCEDVCMRERRGPENEVIANLHCRKEPFSSALDLGSTSFVFSPSVFLISHFYISNNKKELLSFGSRVLLFLFLIQMFRLGDG